MGKPTKAELQEQVATLEHQVYCMRKLCGVFYNSLIAPPIPSIRERMGVPDKDEMMDLLEQVFQEIDNDAVEALEKRVMAREAQNG